MGNQKKVTIDGMIFLSVSSAMTHYKVSRRTIQRYVSEGTSNPLNRAVMANWVLYRSMKDAAIAEQCSIPNISKKVKRGRPGYFKYQEAKESQTIIVETTVPEWVLADMRIGDKLVLTEGSCGFVLVKPNQTERIE